METVLHIQNINKHYPGFTLENASFSLAPNRIMGLIGKNGAGKSTTLKAILNMVSPESGSVTMFQKNFYPHEKECKQRTGVVFGGIDFYPLKKLSAITAVTRKFYTNWDQERYQKYIRRFALDESKKMKAPRGKPSSVCSASEPLVLRPLRHLPHIPASLACERGIPIFFLSSLYIISVKLICPSISVPLYIFLYSFP